MDVVNEKTDVKKKEFKEVFVEAFQELGQTFVAFAKAPKALWGINIPYVLEGLVYFGILTILGKYCSENVQLTDPQAGWVYSLVTAGITFAMLFLGGVSDKIGVRKALALSFILFFIGRSLIAVSGTFPLGHGIVSPMFGVMSLGLLIAVVAYGLYQPAAYAGVKRYTTPKTAAMGYAVIYGLMNLGAFLSGLISPRLREAFASTFPPNGLTSVYWVYAGLCLVALVVSVTILSKKTDESAVKRVAEETRKIDDENKNDKTDDETVKEEKIIQTNINNIPLIIYGLIFILMLSGTIAGYNGKEFLSLDKKIWFGLSVVTLLMSIFEFLRKRPDHPFRNGRFTFFIFILIPVQTLFAHNWLTIPYYLDRVFSGTFVSRNFEAFSNINPLLIFVLTPIVAGLTARANVYRMMIIGTLVMALPTFLLAFTPNIVFFLVYVILMSIGEAMWQPRFLQWIAEIAPEGKTGLYMGIGQFPWFLTKFMTGLYSGYFIAKYIPKPDSGLAQNSEFMWLIYAFIAMISPVALILAKKWMASGMKKHN